MNTLRQKLDEIFPQLPKTVVYQNEEENEAKTKLPQYASITTPGVTQCLDELRRKVQAHIRFADFIQNENPLEAENQEEALPPPQPTAGEEASQEAGPTPPTPVQENPQSPYLQTFVEDYLTNPEDKEEEENPNLADLSPEALHFYHILEKEIQYAEALGNLVMSPLATLQRMKKAQQAFVQGRLAEAVTVLKTAKREDPKNRGLSFVISQLYYYRVHQGLTEFLPEAREEGFKSGVQDDNLPFSKQLYYRYHSMASERPFSAERCLGMLREYQLLSPEAIEGEEGFVAHEKFHLYSWVVLSTIPPHLWNEFEIKSLISLTEKSIIGVPFYLHFFHPHVLSQLEEENENFLPFQKLTKKINKSHQAYQEIILPLNSHFNLQTKLPLDSPPLLWTVQNRYLKIFLEAAPIPSFDEILLHTSLDGRRFLEDAPPTHQLKNKGLTETNYWHTWAISIACDAENRANRIPTAQVLKESRILSQFTHVLEALRTEEAAQLDYRRLEKAKKYFAEYTLQQIKNFVEDTPTSTSMRHGPRAVYQKIYHRQWQHAGYQFPSLFEMVNTIATAGAFADVYEIYTALDLIEKNILTSPENSPKARLEKAWDAYQMQEYGVKPENRAGGSGLEKALMEHFMNAGWFYLFVVPSAAITFIVVFAAGDIQSALKLVLFLGGGALFIGLVIYNQFKK